MDIHQLTMSSDEIGGWYTKGHVPTKEFRRALNGREDCADDDASCAKIRHVWLRQVPRSGGFIFDSEMMMAEPKSRGAFKATLMMVNGSNLR